METEETAWPELLHDRSMSEHCPKLSKKALLIYKTPLKEFLDAVVPVHIAESNHYREHPCAYCTKMKRDTTLAKQGSWNEFRCEEYNGRIIEIGILDHKGTSQQNLASISFE
jgi:hypothetical protein